MLKVALIGLGVMGKNHFRTLLNLHLKKVIKFTLICDIRDYNELGLDDSYDFVHHTKDYGFFISNAYNFDLVVVATNTTSHYQICKDLLNAKVNVLVEKPICTSVKEAIELKTLSIVNNVKLSVGHIERFNPCFYKIKELIPMIGDVTSFNFTRIGLARQSFDVGILLDLGIHDFDLVNILFWYDFIYNTVVNRNEFGSDIASLTSIQYKNGIMGGILNSYDTTYKLRNISINGTTGNIQADLVNSRVYLSTSQVKVEYMLNKTDSLNDEIMHLINAINNNIDISEELNLSIDALSKVLTAIEGGNFVINNFINMNAVRNIIDSGGIINGWVCRLPTMEWRTKQGF